MRVLIACEFSGIVRDAFRARGHDAWSCDLLPTERSGPHYIMDAVRVIEREGPWDLLIGHPPCTFIANSGVRWLIKDGMVNQERAAKLDKALFFFQQLWNSGIPMIALENPIPHKYARRGTGAYTQLIQPWMFGHGETKATCLWLKNLPKLIPTNVVEGRTPRVHHASPGPDRWKERSRTLPGIAEAMSEQWGNL